MPVGRTRKFSRQCEGLDEDTPCDNRGARYRSMTDTYQCDRCYAAWCVENGYMSPDQWRDEYRRAES